MSASCASTPAIRTCAGPCSAAWIQAFGEAVLLTREGYRSPTRASVVHHAVGPPAFMVKGLGGISVAATCWWCTRGRLGCTLPRLRLHRRPLAPPQPAGGQRRPLAAAPAGCSTRWDADIRQTQPEDHVICLDYHDLLVARHGIRCAGRVGPPLRLSWIPPDGSTFGLFQLPPGPAGPLNYWPGWPPTAACLLSMPAGAC